MPDLNTATLESLTRHRLIPVISLPDAGLADPLGDALVEAGLPCAEITLRTPAAEESIRRLAKRGDLFVAAGTVLTVEQAQRAAEAGASCLLSPGTDASVIDWCGTNAIDVIPGVATPTDILQATQLGLSTLKFFPAETMGGPSALQAIAGPFPDLKFIPTGGITHDSLADYLKLPNVLACGGSWMVNRSMIEAGDMASIRALVYQAVEQISRMPA